jgi:hypothetical protein
MTGRQTPADHPAFGSIAVNLLDELPAAGQAADIAHPQGFARAPPRAFKQGYLALQADKKKQ